MLVNLVCDDPQTVFVRPGANGRRFQFVVHRSRRVGRGYEKEHLGPGGEGAFEVSQGDFVAAFGRGGDLDRHPAGQTDRLGVCSPIRRRHQHLVARVKECRKGLQDGLLAAVGDDHLGRLDL